MFVTSTIFLIPALMAPHGEYLTNSSPDCNQFAFVTYGTQHGNITFSTGVRAFSLQAYADVPKENHRYSVLLYVL